MVFDVDKLKEALKTDDESAERDELLLDAARLVVAGQPLWWCEKHNSPTGDRTVDKASQCHLSLENDLWSNCRMVEWWGMPIGKDET